MNMIRGLKRVPISRGLNTMIGFWNDKVHGPNELNVARFAREAQEGVKTWGACTRDVYSCR